MYDIARFVVHDNFLMPQLARTRKICVYLPADYERSEQSYPVLYMHDGQNLFDSKRSSYGDIWNVAETLDRAQVQGDIQGCIVVAIDNGSGHDGLARYNEYSPWKMDAQFDLPSWQDDLSVFGGEGALYLQFIVQTLKPFIDQTYRTLTERQHTALIGSSMGGLISLYGASFFPDIFGFTGVFSPAFWFNDFEIFSFMQRVDIQLPLAIYMDIGSNESSDDARADFNQIYLNGARRMRDLLKDKSPRVELFYQEAGGALHNEKAWAARFPDMLRVFEQQRLRCL